jgi:hypothetical protein
MARHCSFGSVFKREVWRDFLEGRAGMHDPLIPTFAPFTLRLASGVASTGDHLVRT